MVLARGVPGRFGTAADLAREAGVDLPELERLFLTHAHLGVAAFLEEARVKAACRLLLDSSGPVQAVGEACGFRSGKDFLTRFRAATGCAPGSYQALGRNRRTRRASP